MIAPILQVGKLRLKVLQLGQRFRLRSVLSKALTFPDTCCLLPKLLGSQTLLIPQPIPRRVCDPRSCEGGREPGPGLLACLGLGPRDRASRDSYRAFELGSSEGL